MAINDKILLGRPLECPFLWSLKLTPEEYKELKLNLKKAVLEGELSLYRREAALYFSEWWRREYNGGYAKISEVCDSLFGNAPYEEEYKEKLYTAAKEGAEQLGLQVIKTKGEKQEQEQVKYSLYYQGGLPMNYIVKEIKRKGPNSTKWASFFRALVWDEQVYTELPEMGKTASLSDSLREFCNDLQSSTNIFDAPFSPEGSEEWWSTVIHEFELEKKEKNSRTPFIFRWILRIDEHQRKICPMFQVTGPSILPPEFVKAREIEDATQVSFSILINGNSNHLAEFIPNDGEFYSRRSINKTFNYHPEDVVEIILQKNGNNSEVLASRFLDFSCPKLMSLSDRERNLYSLCDTKEMTQGNCIVISTDDWENEASREVGTVYKIEEKSYHLFHVNGDCIPLELSSAKKNKKKIFNPNLPLSWTSIEPSCALNLPVPTKEKIYNSEKGIIFYEEFPGKRKKCKVSYEGPGSRDNNPGFGVIRASVKKDNGDSVDSIRFINVGNLTNSCTFSSAEICEIELTWPHGIIESADAEKIGENTWRIEKKKMKDSRYSCFSFKPSNSCGYSFTLSFLIPFYGFHIFDYMGKEIKSRSMAVPFSELNSFRYYLRLQDSLKITHGTNRYNDGITYLYSENAAGGGITVKERMADRQLRECQIPNEGSLASLFFDGSDHIAFLYEKQTTSLPESEVIITVSYNNEQKKIIIKDFPYRLSDNGDTLSICEHRDMPPYTSGLFAVPFDNPELEPVRFIREGESEIFAVPKRIKDSQYNEWLVYGDIMGNVLPIAIFPKVPIQNEDSRKASRKRVFNDKKKLLANDKLFSKNWMNSMKWLDIIQEGKIPGSSILELVAISDDRELLGKFALQVFMSYTPEEKAASSLKELGIQLSFLWKWASISNARIWLESLSEPEYPKGLKQFYRNWIENGKDKSEWSNYTSNNSHLPECFDDFIEKFNVWFKGICKEPAKKYLNADIQQNGGDERLSDEAKTWFSEIRNLIPEAERRRLSPDDLWKEERRKFSEVLCSMNLGDLSETEDVKFEIRKSILFGLKYKLSDEE